LHIARFFHPHLGGTEAFIAGLADALGPDGVESRALVTDRYRVDSGPEPRIPVTTVPVVGFREADLIHLHDIRFLFETSFFMSRIFRKPLVLSTHGFIFHTETFSAAKAILWKTWYVRAMRRLDKVIAVSRRDQEFCLRNGISANLELVPNPVDVGRFLGVTRGPAAEEGPLLYFGRISRGKGVDRLAGTMSESRWSLEVLGKGDARSMRAARAALAAVGGRVRWNMSASDEDLRRALASCRCVVLPSRSEAFGIAMIEALAAGAPVVASDIPALREIAPPIGVALVDFDDTRAVQEGIEFVTRHHDPEAAKNWARRFSWDRGAKHFLRIYEEVLAAR
jgi:glycosyltransferase involved in cell wall biosynthesis